MAVNTNAPEAAAWFVQHAVSCNVIDTIDEDWAYNRILEAVGAFGPACPNVDANAFDLDSALDALAEVAVSNGLVEDSATGRDRAAMRVAGSIMPRPSEVAARFDALAASKGPEAATDWFYTLCCDVNYVRKSAIARNLKWAAPTRWGELEITINKSKPEKDPRDIAAAGSAAVGEAYPACQLCVQNEGYSGRPAALGGGHPARQNLRIVPIELGGERWGFQYSPYAYFNEHCIAMSSEHRPMHVDRAAFSCLLDFVDRFPHYFIGSNADLPIVGLEWPLSVIRLRSDSRDALLDACEHVLLAWRSWDEPKAGVVSHDADGTRHNTVTPICRRRGEAYEMDLALRCNITTDEHPLGVFHPHEDKWHVKKENIGLIEVMGLAILPPRLEGEMDAGRLSQEEIGRVFGTVLEDAGVFKWDEDGRAAQARFGASLE